MTKPDIIKAFSEKYDYTRKESVKIFEDVTNFIVETLKDGESIDLYGILKMGTEMRRERIGVNPSTQERIVIPAKRTPYCRFGNALKETISNG